MTPNEFVISKVKVDIVYGSAPKAVAEKPYIFNLKTSVQYLGSEQSVRYSGSPGYIKGKPLLIGAPAAAPGGGADQAAFYGVEYSQNGFSLRGADNDGKCYFLKKPVADGVAEESVNWDADRTVEDVSEKRYYDDPVLTFEDAMIFGCTLELTQSELEEFCNKNKWKNLMIF